MDAFWVDVRLDLLVSILGFWKVKNRNNPQKYISVINVQQADSNLSDEGQRRNFKFWNPIFRSTKSGQIHLTFQSCENENQPERK